MFLSLKQKHSLKQFITLISSVFILISVLSSCGFKFRGDYLLSPKLQTLYVSSEDVYGELTRQVKQYFVMNKINVLQNPQNDVAELRILTDKLDRRTLSVFNNGQVAEYELIYTVKYQLRIPQQEVQQFKFELNRDYQDDPNSALAKSRELNLMLTEMRKQAADKILRNLASIQI
jgi:LPS-assembly lipoprotein